jgi:hypothetical protein
MMGRVFTKHLRLRHGRIETIRTRFELNKGGELVEHVTVETHDRPTFLAVMPPRPREKDANR